MAAYEKDQLITFGATIERPASPPKQKPQQALRSPPSNASTMTSVVTTEAAKQEWAADPSNPYSAFYTHGEGRRSLDGSAPPSKTFLDVNVLERDLEPGVPLSVASTQAQPKVSVDGRVKECAMWPSRQDMVDKQKAARRKRGGAFFRNLTNKQRLWAKIIIALLVVAAAVGLGVGISRAVGGGVWAGEGRSKDISSHDRS